MPDSDEHVKMGGLSLNQKTNIMSAHANKIIIRVEKWNYNKVSLIQFMIFTHTMIDDDSHRAI